MTETALNEKIAKLTENELSEAHLRSKGRRRLRRVRDIQKSDRLLHIINYGGYAPHRGYIEWGFDGRTQLHTRKYIKYPQIATVKDGSSEKPADGSAAAGTLRQKEIFIAAYLTTGGRCIEKRPNAEQCIQANRLFL